MNTSLARDAGGNHDDLGTVERLVELVPSVAPHLRAASQRVEDDPLEPYGRTHVDVADVGSNTRRTADVVQAELRDERLDLEQ